MNNETSPLTFEEFIKTKPYSVEEFCNYMLEETAAVKPPPEGALEKGKHELTRSLYHHYLKEQADKILANHHFPSIDAIEKYKPVFN